MKKERKLGYNSQTAEIWRRFRKNKAAMIGLAIFIVFLLAAVFASFIVPYDAAIEQNGGDLRLMAPCAEHLFGTDQLGRDIFARIIHGARYSLSIGVATSFFTLVVGGALGSIAAYYGGKVDSIIMRVVDIFMCIPFMLLALAIVSALGPSLRNLLIAITISNLPGTIRLVRSCILNVVDVDYIEAARSYGTTDARIIFRHIFPNAMGPIIVNTTMGMANMILAAAGLSFMGMGIQPPTPEWGNMLSNARDFMLSYPHMLYIPGIAILIAVLSINLIGDGLRDALDPKLKD